MLLEVRTQRRHPDEGLPGSDRQSLLLHDPLTELAVLLEFLAETSPPDALAHQLELYLQGRVHDVGKHKEIDILEMITEHRLDFFHVRDSGTDHALIERGKGARIRYVQQRAAEVAREPLSERDEERRANYANTFVF